MATTTQPTTEREHYLAWFQREYETTLRALKAYPADQAQLKFAERSNTAAHTAWILVLSQMVVPPILTMPSLQQPSPSEVPPVPTDWKQIVGAFEKGHADATQALAKLDDATFQSPIVMPSGPGGATAPMRRADALWMMLFDTVHHRGQFSVYLRASGAKVPSIYGGSADEPWS